MKLGPLVKLVCATAVASGCASTSVQTASGAGTGGAHGPGASSPASSGSASASGASGTSSSLSSSSGGVPCGSVSGMRGLTMQSVMVGTTERTYLMYLPETLSPTAPAPFVYVFHGASMSGQEMHDITEYASLADSEGIAVVFPDGEGGPGTITPWNVENPGQVVCGDGAFVSASGDDFGFMDAMKAVVSSHQCLDPAHVFATGFSMGGYFSHHIGCYRSDVRAVAPASGGTIASLSSCTTGHVPVILFHGSSDPLIAPGCDDPNAPAVPGYPASATLWAQKNGCKDTYTTLPETGTGGGDGQCYLYDGCPADGQVELCTFTAMGHCWPGGSITGTGAQFSCPTYASATALQWAFFKQYAW